jgi:hypothetical protein
MKRDIAALVAYLAERATMPHEFGRKANDCLAFVAGAAKEQTGKDPARGLQWKDEKSALRLLKKLGGVEAILDARFERVPPSLALRGDIAGVPDERLGIHPFVIEGKTICAPGARGLKRAPRLAMTIAWDVTKPKKAKR